MEKPPQRPLIALLLKFGSREHLEQFRDGLLYCNGLKFFTRLENERKHVYDRDEGLWAIYHPQHIQSLTFTVPGKEPIVVKPSALAAPIRLGDSSNPRIFCMYAVHPGPFAEPFDSSRFEEFLQYLWIRPRMYGFGEHVAIVTNGAEFIRRIENACTAQGLVSSGHLVQYVDMEKSGSFSEDKRGRIKDLRFQIEREYRILFPDGQGTDDPFLFRVGSLKDIVVVKTWDEFRHGTKFKFPNEYETYPLVQPKRLPWKKCKPPAGRTWQGMVN